MTQLRGHAVAAAAALLLGCGATAVAALLPEQRPTFLIGADISWVPQQEAEGRQFRVGGEAKEILALLKEKGFNAIRLRIFNDPKAEKGYSRQGYCGLEETLRMARRVKDAGMQLMLDFHYSDTWADPGHQNKPAAWADLDFDALKQAVHDYTRDVLLALKRQGTLPEMVQVGNEISNGFLWPDGKPPEWEKLCALFQAGAAAVREVDPSIRVILHLAMGGQNAGSRWFLDNALKHGMDFDILGQSYYVKWHGTLQELKANLEDLAARYGRPIMVVEYTVPGIREVNDIVRGLPGGKGLGTFIWEPTKWEKALFDDAGNAKPEMDLYPAMAGDYGKR